MACLYSTVLSDDHSRVVLTPTKHDPHSDYVNASYIDVSSSSVVQVVVAELSPSLNSFSSTPF